MTLFDYDFEFLNTPRLNVNICLRCESCEVQMKIGSVMSDCFFSNSNAVCCCVCLSTDIFHIITRIVVIVGYTLDFILQSHSQGVSRTPGAQVAHVEPDDNLVVVQRNASKVLGKKVVGCVLT